MIMELPLQNDEFIDLGAASVETRGDGQLQIDVSTGRLNFIAGLLVD
jgi:hypothetical protein